MAKQSNSFWLTILLHLIGNIAVIWALTTYANTIFTLQNNWSSIVSVGAVLTLLNFIIRPILTVFTLPLKLFATMIATVIINGGILQLITIILHKTTFIPAELTINQGLLGWLLCTLVIGVSNWAFKESFR